MNKADMIKSRTPYRFVIGGGPFEKKETRAMTQEQIERGKRQRAIEEAQERKRLNAEIADVIDEIVE